MSDPTAAQLVQRIAECSAAMAFQSGSSGVEIAGWVISHLAAHPEHIGRFFEEGNELWIDQTISHDTGCLSYRTLKGDVLPATVLRDDH